MTDAELRAAAEWVIAETVGTRDARWQGEYGYRSHHVARRLLELLPPEDDAEPFAVGDEVTKTGGDYSYSGRVVGRLVKKSGAVRWVVEDDRGLLFIFNASQLIVVNKR